MAVERARFRALLRETGLVAILRGLDLDDALRVADALFDAGVRLLEVALSRSDDAETIRALRDHAPDGALVGAGTVTSAPLARTALDHGAEFFVTPHVAEPVLDHARSHDIAVVCGATTPTEIARAREGGADFIKLFPAAALGPAYLRALLGPYPDLEAVVVGGIHSSNVAAFLEAGAVGAGVGGALATIRTGDTSLADVRDEAARLLSALAGRR